MVVTKGTVRAVERGVELLEGGQAVRGDVEGAGRGGIEDSPLDASEFAALHRARLVPAHEGAVDGEPRAVDANDNRARALLRVGLRCIRVEEGSRVEAAGGGTATG